MEDLEYREAKVEGIEPRRVFDFMGGSINNVDILHISDLTWI